VEDIMVRIGSMTLFNQRGLAFVREDLVNKVA